MYQPSLTGQGTGANVLVLTPKAAR